MAETDTEKKSSGWVNISVPLECFSEKHIKIDTANIETDPITGEEYAARSAWFVVTLPKGFELNGEDIGGHTFNIPADPNPPHGVLNTQDGSISHVDPGADPDKNLPDDPANKGWKRIGFRSDSVIKLRARDENEKVTGIREVLPHDLAEAAKTGFGEKPATSVFINFGVRSVSGPTINKETGQETYIATIPPNTFIDGLDVGGYKVNFPKEIINEKTGKSNVFEHKKTISFMVPDNRPLDLLLVDKNTGAVSRLPKQVTAGTVKEACEKSFDAYMTAKAAEAQEKRDKKASRDAPEPKRVSSQKKAAPAETAPTKTQAKS